MLEALTHNYATAITISYGPRHGDGTINVMSVGLSIFKFQEKQKRLQDGYGRLATILVDCE